MGLFSKFKKSENNAVKSVPDKKEISNYSFSKNKEGKLQLDYIDQNPDFKNFYDTTRLIVDNVNGNLVDCRISWYGQNDAVMLNDKGEYVGGRRDTYSNVLAEIDFNLLKNDKNYVKSLMENLLNQKRVSEYLERGMLDNPQTPCGKYVGGIALKNDRYTKIFNANIGEMSHNSPEMVAKRQRAKEKMNAQRENEIKMKQEKIKRLKSEIDEMSR